ncbi:MAG TPA: tripartite tricarboxylate transporter permease, partial [Dehalococcoidia bacterium]|nr:tripartite tricarboxylate transporter permease [Dehalococcoidia bacterium]
MWLEGLVIVLDPSNLLALGIGALLGIIIGALPGLGPVFALTLFLPVTFPMSAEMALIFLISLYSGTIYGGSISAILLNAPGTPGSVATCL